MRPFIGHRDTLNTISHPLPACILLTGPEGVGKRTLAHRLARITEADGLDLQVTGPLTVEKAHEVKAHHARSPLSSPKRTSVVDLTDASPKAVNAVLKILEEPPAYSHLILHSDRVPPLTLRSRCFTMQFGLLTEAEVVAVLKGLGIPEPEGPARLAGGRVSAAVQFAKYPEARRRVEALLRALTTRNNRKVERALAEALAAAEGEEDIRETVSDLLALSLLRSLSDSTHVLSNVPPVVRNSALHLLHSRARPALKVRGAVWGLMK